MTKPKILYIDIESSPNLNASWHLGLQRVPYQAILKDKSILCVSWKWGDKDEVETVSLLDSKGRFKKDPYDDFIVLKKVRRPLIEADIIVGHNGDKFDLKFINGRLALQGMPPVPKATTIDTLKQARKHFNLNSNRLDYLAKTIFGEGKIKTDMDNWLNIVSPYIEYETREYWMGDMIEYNQKDVVLLQRIHEYLSTHFDVPAPVIIAGSDKGDKDNGEEFLVCPHLGCGSTNFKRSGWYRPQQGVREYQRYECKDCGGWFRETTAGRRKSRVRGL